MDNTSIAYIKDIDMSNHRRYATPSKVLYDRYLNTQNPVTRCTLRDILRKRAAQPNGAAARHYYHRIVRISDTEE